MSGGIHLTMNVELWAKQISEAAQRTVYRYNNTVYKSAVELFERVKQLTPVGNPDLWHPPYWPHNYTPGTLKASWEMIIEGNTITISNSQPYAQRVEYGWSSQAPNGMLRRACAEFPQFVKVIQS